MKITIDTDFKTVSFEGQVNVADALEKIKEVLPEVWKDYKLDFTNKGLGLWDLKQPFIQPYDYNKPVWVYDPNNGPFFGTTCNTHYNSGDVFQFGIKWEG